MQPKSVAAWTDYTRKLILQASLDVENFVRADLTAILARAVDLAGLHGLGSSNQPTGVAATSGIGSVAGGTNGAAPTNVHITQLEREVAIDNADVGSLKYITNPKVRYKLKNTLFTATYGDRLVWGESREQPLNGYPALVTNQVSSALTKGSSSGVCSAIFFGNWAELLLGFWSGIDILVDPYSLSTSSHRVVAFQDIDVAVRHAESFAAMLDALTT
jgi:HK97 family phage major capsid protein